MTETCRNCQCDQFDDGKYDVDDVVMMMTMRKKSRSDAVSNGLVFIASLADPPDIEQDIRSVQ